MSRHPTMVFPLEIYTEIISHITDRPTLFALLLTSTFLSQEVEKQLYREPKPGPRRQRDLLVLLSTCSRVAQHVRSYKMPRFGDWVKEVHPALHLLNNLKALTLFQLYFNVPQQPKLSSLVSSVSFQLHKFITNFPVDRHLKSFLRSQPQIMHLELLSGGSDGPPSEPGLVLSRADLPSLTAFHYSTRIPPIYSLFPEFFIVNLNFHGFLTIPLPTVQVLRAIYPFDHPRPGPLSPNMMVTLPFIFPNLRFLDVEYDGMQHLDLEHLPYLQKLKMYANLEVPNAADVVLGFYTRHKSLKTVEIRWFEYLILPLHGILHRVQERVNPETMVAEPVSEICDYNRLDDDLEWATWQG